MFSINVVGLVRQDDLLDRFWIDFDEDRNARELQILIGFFVKETGGQMYYEGRNMAPTHRGM